MYTGIICPRPSWSRKGWGRWWLYRADSSIDSTTKVVLVNQKTKKGYEFPCNRWLAKVLSFILSQTDAEDEDDGEIVRELPLANLLTTDKSGSGVKRTEVEGALRQYKVLSCEESD